MEQPSYKLLQFDDLAGWDDDNHQAALDVFLTTCGDMKDSHWQGFCEAARAGQEARDFFERFFTPVLIDDGQEALFTGYFEPELRGSLSRGGPYQHPLYRLPRDAGKYTRRDIEEDDVLEGRGLEIVWVDDQVDAFFFTGTGVGPCQA